MLCLPPGAGPSMQCLVLILSGDSVCKDLCSQRPSSATCNFSLFSNSCPCPPTYLPDSIHLPPSHTTASPAALKGQGPGHRGILGSFSAFEASELGRSQRWDTGPMLSGGPENPLSSCLAGESCGDDQGPADHQMSGQEFPPVQIGRDLGGFHLPLQYGRGSPVAITWVWRSRGHGSPQQFLANAGALGAPQSLLVPASGS